MREGIALSFDFRLIRPNGSLRWMTTKTETLSDADGNPARVVGVVFDITARKRVEGALDASRDRFQALAEGADGVVWTAQPDGSLEILSDPRGIISTMLPNTPRTWLDLVAEDDRPRLVHAWEAGRDVGEKIVTECRLASEGSGDSMFQLRVLPVVTQGGGIREWLGVCRDIGRSGLGRAPTDKRVQPTGAQLRAGRGILNWSVRELAEQADVSVSTIRRLEELDGSPPSFEPKLAMVQQALENGGVEFIFPSTGKPAVRPV